jgi:hypothetical protein
VVLGLTLSQANAVLEHARQSSLHAYVALPALTVNGSSREEKRLAPARMTSDAKVSAACEAAKSASAA